MSTDTQLQPGNGTAAGRSTCSRTLLHRFFSDMLILNKSSMGREFCASTMFLPRKHDLASVTNVFKTCFVFVDIATHPELQTTLPMNKQLNPPPKLCRGFLLLNLMLTAGSQRSSAEHCTAHITPSLGQSQALRLQVPCSIDILHFHQLAFRVTQDGKEAKHMLTCRGVRQPFDCEPRAQM